MEEFDTLRYKDGVLTLLDQTLLPEKVEYRAYDTAEGVYEAIQTMVVRGAPAIGIAAAYGMAVAAHKAAKKDKEEFIKSVLSAARYLAESRPTAVNLFWALKRMEEKLDSLKGLSAEEIIRGLEAEAEAVQKEDEDANYRIGENLLSLLKDGDTVLTHCNAGMLATSRYGTALSPLYIAKERGMRIKAYADETRPRLQGATLTAFELYKNGIDVTLICDNMAAAVMAQGKINAVITGCDRVAANGDTANKIGTFSLSIVAKHFGVPLYIAAPTSTIDMCCTTGADIPIEERDPREVTHIRGVRIAPEGVKVYNPAFDVTPAAHIAAIATEKGVVYPPYEENLKKIF